MNNCEHEWSYAPFILLTYPEQRPKICRKCGKEEIERGEIFNKSDYSEVIKRFKKNGDLK